MNGTNVTITSTKGMSTLERAKFGPGMLLRHDDLEQLNVYTRELSRLLFRSLFGCGVVCGLKVTPDEKCDKVFITVECGVALGCSGDPIHVPKAQTLSFDDRLLDPSLWVILCGTTKCCAPRPPACPSEDEESAGTCTRERYGFEIRIVRELPRCVCGCPSESVSDGESECQCVDPKKNLCYADHYAGKCGCNAGEDCQCSCDCIVLARLEKPDGEAEKWTVHHAARRFVRPVLISDPEPANDRLAATQKREQKLALQRQQQLAKEREEQLAKERAATEQAAKEQAAKEQAAKEQAAKVQIASEKVMKPPAANGRAGKASKPIRPSK